jgi:hypothetical protein
LPAAGRRQARKPLRELALEVLLGVLGGRQDLTHVEEIHGREAADCRANEDIGRYRFQLLAGDGVEQDLRGPGEQIEGLRRPCPGAALWIAGDIDRHGDVGPLHHHVVRHRVDVAAVDQQATLQRDGPRQAGQRSGSPPARRD